MNDHISGRGWWPELREVPAKITLKIHRDLRVPLKARLGERSLTHYINHLIFRDLGVDDPEESDA